MIRVKDIKPIFTRIITTAEKYENDNTINGVLFDVNRQAGRYKEYQKVVKVGNAVREVKVGDTVLIDPSKYMQRKFSDNSLRNDFVENPIVEINIPTVQMNDEDFFMINESDVAYIISDYEEIPEPSVDIIVPKKPVIVS